MPTAQRDNISLYYESHGTGPALVFAHGGGGNSTVWWQQVPHFADRYQVITFDHRGFGRSPCDPSQVSASFFADDMVCILDDAGVEDAVIVSQSMGGWTAVLTASEYPERVAGVVLGNTSGPVMTPALREAMDSIGERVDNLADLPRYAVAVDLPDRDPGLAFLYQQLNGLNPPMALDNSTLLTFLDDEAIAALDVPMQMIVTDGDVLLPAAALATVAAVLDIEVTEITGSGHSPYFEKPAEFNAVIDAFLARIGW
ncbi:MAG: alpha/beta hydrolase [Actinomycetota bacterium]|jgi:3-oxoadipate enol-lactonase|nr:alpha/beta hydrolase [Actinomycetota bacterium]